MVRPRLIPEPSTAEAASGGDTRGEPEPYRKGPRNRAREGRRRPCREAETFPIPALQGIPVPGGARANGER